MQKLTMDLEVKLEEHELLKMGQTIASKMVKYDQLEEEKKETTRAAGETLKELRAEMSALAKTIRKKTETRSVNCTVEMNTPVVGTKRFTRLDTGEVFKESPMTMEERQTNLFGEEPKGKQAAVLQ